ncbi:MAG: VWA domain-containing protein, partial [Anaerolineales bacterium]
ENPPMTNLSDDLTPDEASMLADALRQFSDQIRKMLERLMEGKQLSQEELERLAKFVGLGQADNLRYREWMTQRMQKALRFREVREALQELAELLAQMGMNKQRVEQLQQMIGANMQSLEDQLRQYAGQRIAENMSQQPPDDSLDNLMNRPFNALSDQEMDRLRKEVRRIAAAMRTRVALRQKRSKSGQLDAKATIRANLKHGNVPILIKHREHTLKPRLVVLCDISTSMRHCSELMLSLLYELQDQISKTYAFAFIDHLEFISPDFDNRDIHKAVREVLERMPSGYYNTDLGFSLENFNQDYLDTIDSRTTFLIVGDGRNNYNDPRMDLFKLLTRRSRRT